MRNHFVLLILCLTISTGSLGAAYLIERYWQILFLLSLLIILWLWVKKYSVFWSASLYLIGYVVLTAIGIMIDLSHLLLLITGTTTLASWELVQFTQRKGVISPTNTNDLLGKYHLKSLEIATFYGFGLAFLSSTFSFKIPFSITLFLVFIVFGGLLFGLGQYNWDKI